MDITSKEEEVVLGTLCDIFPQVIGDRKIEAGNKLQLSVKEISSIQYTQLYELTVEYNLNIHLNRSGGGITIKLY